MTPKIHCWRAFTALVALFPLLSAQVSPLLVSSLNAGTIYWDADANSSNNNINGTGLGGSGIWDSGTASVLNWWNTSAEVQWNNANNDTAVFAGSAGTVTISSTTNNVTVGGITFNTSGYVITGTAGNTLTFAAGTDAVIVTGTNTINANLAGTGAMNISASGTSPTLLNLGGTNTLYTGPVTISSNVTLQANGVTALTGNTITLSGGNLTLNADGNGVGSGLATGSNGIAAETINFNNNLTITSSGTITVGKQTAALFSLNKTTRENNLTIGAVTLTVVNNNAYGLLFSGTTNFTGGAPTFSVAGGAASNITSGLILAGPVTSASPVGFVKTGAGGMVLTGSNTFGGAGAIIDIQGGIVAANSDAALGNPANSVRLNTNSTSQGFRAIGTFSSSRVFILNTATNDIEVTQGNTLTLSTTFGGTLSSALQKNDNGTLILSANNSGYSGALTIAAGAVQIQNAQAIGTGATTVSNASGAALQLANNITLSKNITINNTGINNNGSLESVSGTNTASGLITLASNATIGADTGSTLNLTGTITGAFGLTLSGTGLLNISATLSNITSLTKIGTGTANFTAAASGTNFGTVALSVNGGIFILGGTAGAFTAPAATGTITVNSGATLKVDNSSGALNNRLGGSNRVLNLVNGTFEYADNSTAAAAENLGTLISAFGANTIQVDTTTASGTLIFSALNGNAVNGASTLNFVSAGTGAAFGTTNNRVFFTTAPALTGTTVTNLGIIQRAVVNGADFATYATGTGIIAYTNYNNNGAYTDINSPSVNATDTLKIGPGFITNSTLSGTIAKTVNAVNISGNGLTLNGLMPNGNTTLTLTAGNLLVTGGSDNIGNGLVVASGGTELAVNVNAGATLVVNGAFTNSANFTKGLGGNLVFNSPQYFNTSNGSGSFFTINGGTVTLNGGVNTIFPTLSTNSQSTGQNLAISAGGKLDLNGNSQLFGDIRTVNNTQVVNSSGTITNTTQSATLYAGNNNTNWGGQIIGNIYFAKSGAGVFRALNDNTYSGGTLIASGQLILLDYGRLSLTGSIDINYSGLVIDNTGLANIPDRINDAAPIVLRGGTLTFNGRAQTASAETLGAVIIQQGYSTINTNSGGTGVNSATLTLASLTSASPDAVLAINGGSLGLIGSNNPRVIITSMEPAVNTGLTNKIIGGWAINQSTGEFLTYSPSLGVGGLGAAGFYGYDGTTFPANYVTFSGTDTPQNIRTTTGTAVPSGGSFVNAVHLTGTISTGFTNPTDILNIVSGGLSANQQNVSIGSTVDEGRITSGGLSASGTKPLYIFNSANTLTVNSRIIDNTFGAATRLVLTGTFILANANNTYTGGTVINAGTVNLSATNGVFFNYVIPAGGLTLNNAAVIENGVAGQIDPTNLVTLNGGSVLTLTGANTLSAVTFNNIGGSTNPAITGGTLTLTSGTSITATGNNAAFFSSISSVLAFGGSSTTISVAPVTVNGVANIAPLTPNLIISGSMTNLTGVTKTGAGLLQITSANTFFGDFNLTSGGLYFTAGSSPNLVNSAQQLQYNGGLTSPIGTGTLNVSPGTYFVSTGQTIANNVNVLGDGSSNGSFSLKGAGSFTMNGNLALPSGVTTITVDAPQATLALNGLVSGGGITKNGMGTLQIGIGGLSSISNAFTATGNPALSGSIILNQGAIVATLQSGAISPLGTGPVIVNGGLLELHTQFGSNSSIYYGNDVTFNNALTAPVISVNLFNSASSAGFNTIVMGNLSMSTTGTLTILGGNNYTVRFNSLSPAILSSTTPFKVALAPNTGLSLPGGFNDSNRPVNTNTLATLFFGGSNNFSTGTVLASGSAYGAAPTVNATTSPFGLGKTITLNAGAYFPVVPVTGMPDQTSISSYTQGGLTARYYSYNAAVNLNSSLGLTSQIPEAVVGGVYLGDSVITNKPPVISNSLLTNGAIVYSGLLQITTGGVYTFQSAEDDQSMLVIDGVAVTARNTTTAGGGQGINLGPTGTGSINLSAGLHSIVVKYVNNGGGGGYQLLYSGPDTATNGIGAEGPIPTLQPIPTSALYYNVNDMVAGFSGAAKMTNLLTVNTGASVTIDGQGTDINSAVAGLTLNANSTLNITNQLGTGWFGVSGTTVISGTNVTLSPASGALYLGGGIVDSGNGVIKSGTGMVILGPSTAFTGNLIVNSGGIQVTAANSLTSGSTILFGQSVLDLNGTSNINGKIFVNATVPTTARTSNSPANIYNSSPNPASVNGNITIAGTTPAIGGYGDIVLNGTVTANAAWSKVGTDTLILSGTNALNQLFTISQGIVALGSPRGLGGTGTASVSSGAVLDLNGITNTGTTVTLFLNGSGITGLPMNNTLGSLINSSVSSVTFSSPITLNTTSSIGGNILIPSISGSSNGDITLSGVISGGGALVKVGANNLTLTGSESFTGGQTINSGGLILNGGGRLAAGGGATTANMTTTVTVDDSITNLSNRFGGHSLILSGANLIINGVASGTSSEILSTNGGSLQLSAGQSSVLLNLTGTSSAIVFGVGNLIRNLASSVVFTGSNLGSTPGIGVATISSTATTLNFVGQTGTAGQTNRSIWPFALVDTSGGVVGPTSFATYSPTNGVQALGTSDYSTGITTNANVVLTTATAVSAASTTINSLTLNNSSTVTIPGGSDLRLDSGGLLALAGNQGIIGSGTLTVTNNFNRELIIHTPGAAVLSIQPTIYVNAGGLTKADGGTLILQGQTFVSGTVAINSGTVQLAAGVQTMFIPFTTSPSAGNTGAGGSGQVLQVNYGGVLDLNGNDQSVAVLNSASILPLTGGTVTNSGFFPSNFRIAPNATGTWSGNIAGAINLIRDGNNTFVLNSPNDYNGSTTLTGGATVLVDYGTILNTGNNSGNITITRATLKWDDTGIVANSNRINPFTPIFMNGGGFQFINRAGTTGTATIGDITLNSGESFIQANPANGGNAVININSIFRNPGTGAGVNFSGGSGAIGEEGRIYFNFAPFLTNGILGGWATVTASSFAGGAGSTFSAGFATYDPAGGIHSVNQNAAYNTFGPSYNVVMQSNLTLPAGGASINTLAIGNAGVTLNFNSPSDVLTLQAGGLLADTNSQTRNIGTAAVPGILTAGPFTTELFIHNGNGTMNVNSLIVDNGNPLNVIFDSMGFAQGVINLTNTNAFTGTAFIETQVFLNNPNSIALSTTNIVISGGNNQANDSMPLGNTQLALLRSNQINPLANIVINGEAQLNLNGNSNTLNSIIIINDGGTVNSSGPTVLTGTGLLTVSGTISSTPISSFTIPVINGFLAVSGSQVISVDSLSTNPGQIGLSLGGALVGSGTLIKAGNGVLGVSGMSSSFTGPVVVSSGVLALAQSNAFLGNSPIILAQGASLDTRGIGGGVFGLITGSGNIVNYSIGASGSILTGLDNSSGTFAGFIYSTFAANTISVTKVGTGNWNLTADNTTFGGEGTLTVSQGSVTLNGATAKINFGTTVVNSGGTLNIDNSINPLSNRIGAGRNLTIAGGNVNFIGSNSAGVAETIGTLSDVGGGGVLTLTPGNSGSTTIVASSFPAQTTNMSLLILGLGNVVGPGTANLSVTTPNLIGGSGSNGNTNMSIRFDILGDTSPTGIGQAFVTKDTVTGFIRPLAASEMSGTLAGAATNTNVSINNQQILSASTNPLTSLTLQSGGGVTIPNYGVSGTLTSLNVPALLAFAGNAGITGGQINTNGTTQYYHVLAGGTLNMNTALVNTAGWVKADGGTLLLSQPIYSSGLGAVNGGTVILAGGANTLLVIPTATIPTVQPLNMNGGILDLNGNTQAIGTLGNNNTIANSGGTILNNGTAANLIVVESAASTFGGVIADGAGVMGFVKSGAANLTLTSSNVFSGALTVQSGTLFLKDMGAVATNTVNVNYAGLVQDNTGLYDSISRITPNATVNLNGGLLQTNARTAIDTQTINTLNLGQGQSTLNETLYNSTASGAYTVQINNLTRNPGAVINFTNNGGTLSSGSAANGGNNPYVVFNNPPVLINNILGGWAVINGGDWATTATSSSFSGARVGAMGNTGAGFPGYSGTTDFTGAIATDNINMDATSRTLSSGSAKVLNSLRFAQGTATTETIGTSGTGGASLTITSGGILTNATATLTFNAADGNSFITSGTDFLYVFANQNADIFNIKLTGSNGFVKSGAGTVTFTPSAQFTGTLTNGATTAILTSTNGIYVGEPISGTGIPNGTYIAAILGGGPGISGTVTLSQSATSTLSTTVTVGMNNTYTGVTYVNAGTLNLNAMAATGTTSVLGVTNNLAIPGDLVIANGATVSENNNAGQIAATSSITINGGGVLNLTGTNTLARVTFNNIGGNVTPAVNTGASLILSASDAITVQNDNYSFTPTISGSALALSSATPTINVTGLSPTGMIISAPINSAGGVIVKTGSGSLILSNGSSTFSNGFNLQQGAIIFAASTTLTSGTVSSGPIGTGTLTLGNGVTILSDNGTRTIANSVLVNNSFSFGGSGASNLLTLSGTITLAGSSGTSIVIVAAPIVTSTISGRIVGTGTTALGKDGPGSLVLTHTANSFAKVVINQGLIKNGTTGAIPNGADVVISSPAYFDLNNIVNQVIGALSGSGTIFSSSGAPTLFVGGTSTSDQTSSASSVFAGTIAGAMSIAHTGTGNLTLSGSNTFTGNVTINMGSITAANSNALGAGNKTVTISPATYPTSIPGLHLDGSAGSVILGSNVSIFANYDALNGGVPIAGKAAIVNDAGNNTIQGNITLTGGSGGGMALLVTSGTLTLSGTISPNATSRALDLRGGGVGIISGIISDAGGNLLSGVNRDSGSGTWILSNPANAFGAPILITSGTLAVVKLANGGALSSTGTSNNAASNIVIDGGALQYIGSGDSTDRLFTSGINGSTIDASGSGAIAFTNTNAIAFNGTNAPRTIQFSGSNTGNNSFAGAIGDNGTGSTSVTKLGSGTWLLTGNNTYSGVTLVSSGILKVGSTSALGSSAGSLNVTNGILDLNNTFLKVGAISGGTAGVITNNTSGTATLTTVLSSSSTYLGTITDGAGIVGLTVTGNGLFVLAGSNNYTGTTLVGSGTLQVGNGTTGSILPTSPVSTGSAGVLGLNLANGGVFANGVNNLGSVNTLATGTNILSGTISGVGSFNQNGAGVTIMSGSQAYTGATNINNGTLQLGDGTTNGSISAGSAITVFSSGTLALNLINGSIFGHNLTDNGVVSMVSSGTTTVTALFTGSGGVVQNGTGFTLITANEAYTGPTTINRGTFQVGDGSTAGASINGGSLVTVAPAGALNLNKVNGETFAPNIFNNGMLNTLASGTNIITGNISGSGMFNQNGSGVIVYSGTNSSTGATNINAGSLKLVGGSISGNINVAANAKFDVSDLSVNPYPVGSVIPQKLTANGQVIGGVVLGPNGTLIGTGTMNGAVSTTGTGAVIKPGASGTSVGNTGIMTVNNNFNLGAGAQLSILIGKTTAGPVNGNDAGTSYSALRVSGAVTLGGALTGTIDSSQFGILGSLSLTGDDHLYIILGATSVSGTFSNQFFDPNFSNTIPAIMVGGKEFAVFYNANAAADTSSGGNDVALYAVPEPAAWAMLLGGFALLISLQIVRRRRGARL